MSDHGFTEEQARVRGVPIDAWMNNVISSDACLGPSGRIGLAHEVRALPDQRSVDALCALVADLAPHLKGLHTGDVGSEGTEPLEPFWVAASDDWRWRSGWPRTVGGMFGSALHPPTDVQVQPMSAWFSAWRLERRELGWQDDGAAWRPVVTWFEEHVADGVFTEIAYVEVVDFDGGFAAGPLRPRLWLGRLPDGSACGAASYVTWS